MITFFQSPRLIRVLILTILGLTQPHANSSQDHNPSQKNPIESFVTTHKELSQETLTFYKQNDYAPVWYPNGQESVAARTAKTVLKTADTEGLNPADYRQGWGADYQKNWVEAEVSLTETFMKFIDHVRVGRIPAKEVSKIVKLVSAKMDPVAFLTDALKYGPNNFEKLTQMAPDLPDYKNLKDLLRTFKDLSAKWGNLPTLQKTAVKVGESDPNIPALKKILAAYGYYSTPDFSATYTQETVDALVNFQRHNNLEADGVIGNDTVNALNTPLKRRIQQIIINMERLRWLPNDMGEKYMMVNVGGYEVMAVHHHQTELRMRAIVGQVGRQTPLFYAPLRNITINPSWSVPHGILVHDKLPKIMHDPSYVERSGFTAYDSLGNRLDPYHVDWGSVGSHVSLRQKPGFQNALGRIKFTIENPYTIYLHGTPTGKLFDKPRRNFSSGCIRLQDPNKLAAWVFKDENGWDEQQIQQKIKSGKTMTIPIKNQITVYFTYQTVWLSDDGKPHFSPDAYKMDDKLIDLLKLKE
jgi:L,D-transpeptidase YcbB